MKYLKITFFVLTLFFAKAAISNCAGAPAGAILEVPTPLQTLFQIECTNKGHILAPIQGKKFVALMNKAEMTFPALGISGVPANVMAGTPVVVTKNGVYPPIVGGTLTSPHDAYFAQNQLTKMEGELLAVANKAAQSFLPSPQTYNSGYLYDLLSNQVFQYRLYVLYRENKPAVIYASYETRHSPPKAVLIGIEDR